MRLVLLGHPPAFATESMPRFAGMIMRGMEARGHQVELWTSRQILGRLPISTPFVRKWLGYADQFLLYPGELRRKITRQPDDTLFVVTDQALGMWIPPLAHRPHVIHCHDFHALKSALGEFPENQVRRTGRRYQQLIRRGFSRGQAFISISERSRSDLHRFLPRVPKISEVVYNGLNYPFRPMDLAERIPLLNTTGIALPEHGFIVHVGGNQWYKNRMGVLKIYRALAAVHPHPPALWLIGAKPTQPMRELAASVPAPGEIHFLSGLTNEQVNAAYAQAQVLLFPSLEEGFGWPIIEAMASGCPVITTNLAPMTEVAGDAARLIPRMPPDAAGQASWVKSAAQVLEEVAGLDPISRASLQMKGRVNAARFETEIALAAYEQIYQRVLGQKENGNPNPGVGCRP
jgi:glycosyltransferase involved in cell wall biosynthesis